MRRSLVFTALLLALIAVLAGCRPTELRVTNRTNGSIQFYSGHTKKAVMIPTGATVTVPHTEGRVIIITQQDVVWEYDAVDIFDYSSEATQGFTTLALAVSVEPSGTLTLASGRKIEPAQKLSPKK